MIEVDPVELEVTRNALIGIAEEAGAVLRRTAYSPNIKERVDCSTAVFDAHGRLVAQAAHIPVHLGSMPASVQAALATFSDLGPGDQVLVSDPYAGGTHLPDWTLLGPVHDETGRVLGLVANRAHHADVGGAAPGSMPAGATDVLAEGLRIPPVRLVRGGDEDRDLVAMLLANTRTPDERVGDLRAQRGANVVAAQRLRELAARTGVDRLAAAMEATLAHAEQTFRAALAELPDGTWSATDHLDDDGAGASHIAITATVTIAGDRLTIDFSGSARTVAGGVNAPRAVTLSACLYAARALVAPDVPANDGMARCLEVITQPDTVVDPLAPAAVAAGNVETSQRIVDVVFAALAPALPDRVPACSQGTMNNVLLGGRAPDGRPFSYYETIAGGQGGRPPHDGEPGRPGMSGVHTHMTNTRNTPVEAFEQAYPIRIVTSELRRGSGGDGAYPGGDGIRRELEVRTDDATVSLFTERRSQGPPGLAGGKPGAPGRNVLVTDDGEEVLPAKVTRRLHFGDRIVVETPGGGGWGAPPQAGGRASG